MIDEIFTGNERDSIVPAPVDYSRRGICFKKGRGKSNFLRPWSQREIVLVASTNTLQYYQGEVLKGSIKLTGSSVKYLPATEADGRDYSFEISNIPGEPLGEKLILAAKSIDEANAWVGCLRMAAGAGAGAGAGRGGSGFGEGGVSSVRLSALRLSSDPLSVERPASVKASTTSRFSSSNSSSSSFSFSCD